VRVVGRAAWGVGGAGSVRWRTAAGGPVRHRTDPPVPAAYKPGMLLRRLSMPPGAEALRAALLLGLLLLAALLLLRLVDVSQRAVAQAQARQAAQALQAEALWRCRALRPAAARQRCLALLREHPPADAAALQALLAEAAS